MILRSFSRFCLVSGLVLSVASPAVAQGLKIDPFPLRKTAPAEEVSVSKTKPMPEGRALAHGLSIQDVRALIAMQEGLEHEYIDDKEIMPLEPAMKPVDMAPPSKTPIMAPPSAPVLAVKRPASQDPLLDRVTVIVHPRGQAVAPPIAVAPIAPAPVMQAPVDVAPILAQPAVPVVEPVPMPSQAALKPVAVVTRDDLAQPLRRRVADLDGQAASVPAMLQEQAMMRGVQGAQAVIVQDPLEGMVMERPNFEQTILQPLDGMSSEEKAVALLEEADEILNKSIANANAQARVDQVMLPGGNDIPAAPREVSAHGNKIIYNLDNIRDVMAEAQPVSVAKSTDEGDLVELAKAPFVGIPADADVAPISIVPVNAGNFWSATPGDNAFDVLSEWSRSAGVELIWNSEFLVDVKQPVDVSGSYEEAVSALLDQYRGLRAGVEGVLYKDGQSGRKTLLIQTNGQG